MLVIICEQAMNERFITTADGARLATEALGEPVQGTILLVMGATASRLWWPEGLKAELVRTGYRVISFDHRDTGESTTHAPGDVRYDIFDIATDLIAILDGYGVSAAHLVGMSLGGYVSQIAALDHPDRALSLTLISSEPLATPYAGEGIAPDFMAHFTTMETLDWSDRAAVTAFLLRVGELSAGSTPFDRDQVLRRIERDLDRSSSMQSGFNHSMLSGDLAPRHRADRLALPVLIVHGSADPVISVQAAEAAARTISGARLMVIEGRGHELVDRDTPQIAQAIVMLAEGAHG
ncbi:MAG: alpha/beta hydrolase [Hyphomicrobiales bacterium]|nr:MAG: alpha/beta hydrolase [Hyphomicrobiales bacterium]